MSEQRTTASGQHAFGHGFTMITGVGGAPVDRSTADRMCRGQESRPADSARFESPRRTH